MSKDGFDNENRIAINLNDKYYNEINPNLQKLISTIFSNIDSTKKIYAKKIAGQNKTDIMISHNGRNISLSVKKGTGNSVHQEPIEDFIEFLKSNYTINEELCDDLRFFIWGDGTLDGKGVIDDRMDAQKLKRMYPKKISNIKAFFHTHRKDLLKRFILSGAKSNFQPDYVYYGNEKNGHCKPSKEIIDWLIDEQHLSNGAIPVGRLTFQAWNRNMNGGDRSEHKRGVIQLKWGTVGKDLKLILENE